MTRLPNPELPNRILEEAEKIVATTGHEAINMRTLAAGVGVSATAIYSYFASKEDLLLRLKLRAADMLNRRIRSISPSLTPHQTLHELRRRYVEFAETHPRLYKMLFEDFAGAVDPEEADRRVLYYTYFTARNALERMAAQGEYAGDPKQGAMMGWIMLHGFCSLLISGRLQLAEGMSREELKDLFFSFPGGGMKD